VDLEKAMEMEAPAMCNAESKKACEHPEKLKGKPEECTPEQIRECHQDVKEHPCVTEE
jgi:hypothetical protein